MPAANHLGPEDVMRISVMHFLGREMTANSLSVTLKEGGELGEFSDRLNQLIDCQTTAQKAFEKPTKILRHYAEVAVDERWYLTRYSDVDVAGMDAHFHFAEYGRSERRFPNAFAEKIDIATNYVDSEWYFKEHPDVAVSGMDAKAHFETYGRSEGRFANFLVKRRLGLAEHVDRRWYLSRYLDVAQSGLDPVEHYIRYGHEEGRFPNVTAEDNKGHSREEFGEFVSSLYRQLLSREIEYFELLGWLGWYKLGLSRGESRAAVEACSRLALQLQPEAPI